MPSKSAGASLKAINENIRAAYARRDRWAALAPEVFEALKGQIQKANQDAGPKSEGTLTLVIEQVPHWDDSRAYEVRFLGHDIGLVKGNGVPAGPVHAHGASLKIAPLVSGLIGASYTPSFLTVGEEHYGDAKPELALLGVFEPDEIARPKLLEELLDKTAARAAVDHWASGGTVRATGD
ncbi:hypothetical protein HUA74_34855 [Myxococcus sp. CA051A]|uniref:Uncharacterized protein n=1 Tax=Myxococcus llanfairpwllgwyngyllgogerychwyrndrobwllllantysiliogogogochensis TaxID=2590453 RepID=A0A540X6B7_9BACT|nr:MULTISPECIES: hypothetical protein [Myxococcus]NTX08032.1 hypothetical protein [Myxococcus sp. CA040A]NTX16083.1 hypothetical protein [Myxococcus sp. CA056]NTX65852.1 hypothetical protein [Myxococcus sp. CA051A]TQF16806.1 hypothetical protein FJV41_06535 [Myxococcus llanfairpwllgwyngyllgogerychwyrndrobwllllantysiliogogogochensis]